MRNSISTSLAKHQRAGMKNAAAIFLISHGLSYGNSLPYEHYHPIYSFLCFSTSVGCSERKGCRQGERSFPIGPLRARRQLVSHANLCKGYRIESLAEEPEIERSCFLWNILWKAASANPASCALTFHGVLMSATPGGTNSTAHRANFSWVLAVLYNKI